MLDFTADYQNQDLANRLTEMFRRQTKKKAAKALFMGVSPLALAACGGGSDSSVVQTLVSGTDGNDTLPNSAANERFEGGLGDDTYTVDLSGIDSVVDAGGDDTIKFVWRDEQSNLQIKNLHTVGNDLVVEMIGSSNIMTIKGAFAEETRIENMIYYHAAGDWGDGLNARLFKFGEAVSGVGGHLVVGTNGNDTVTLTEGDISGVSIWGANGDDHITSGDGNQWIWGGNGDDIVESGAGNDTIFGDDGNDTIYAGDGNDTVYGSDGDDILDAGEGDDNVSGGAGNDIVYMSPGTDIEDGGDGIDTIILGDWAGAYSGTLNLETGGNFADGQTEENTPGHKIYNFENVTTQNTGNMTIVGTSGDNIIQTGAGDDNITAGDGDDTITTGDGNDTINAGGGDDNVNAGAGDDIVDNTNSSGTDVLDGGSGTDTLIIGFDQAVVWRVEVDLQKEYSGVEGMYGEPLMEIVKNFENVTLNLPGASALLMGDNEANILIAGSKDDEIGGRSGSDTLTGNGGADTFVFKVGETGTDTVTDFDLSEGDKLDLSSYGITTEEAAEALMSDSANGVNVTIDGSLILTMTGTTVADFTAADGWLANAEVNDSMTTIPASHHSFTTSNGSYVLVAEQKTYADAAAYARSELNGTLASFETQSEFDGFYSTLQSTVDNNNLTLSTAADGGGAKYIWLGATDSATEGSWVWDSGVGLTYNDLWGSGALGSEPDNFENQDGLAIGMENWPAGSAAGAGYGDAGSWNDIDVSNTLYFVVEIA